MPGGFPELTTTMFLGPLGTGAPEDPSGLTLRVGAHAARITGVARRKLAIVAIVLKIPSPSGRGLG